MRTLTDEQLARLDASLARLDELTDRRSVDIRDETELNAIICAATMVANLLEAGQTVYVGVTNEDGHSVALAQLRLEQSGR